MRFRKAADDQSRSVREKSISPGQHIKTNTNASFMLISGVYFLLYTTLLPQVAEKSARRKHALG